MNQTSIMQPTYQQVGLDLIERVHSGLNLNEQVREQSVGYFTRFLEGWGHHPVGEKPLFQSQLANDGMPFEFSVAWNKSDFEFRILVEAWGEVPSLAANLTAGREVTRLIQFEPNSSISKYQAIEDIFLPANPQPPFSSWHSVAFRGAKRPTFKVYLNPSANKGKSTLGTVTEAMTRLGLRAPWDTLVEKFEMSGVDVDPVYFALDLSDSEEARVKVYFRHDSTREVESICSVASGYRPGSYESALDALGVNASGLLKPLQMCFAFYSGDVAPRETTVYFPLSPNLPNDAVSTSRVAYLLAANGIDPSSYRCLMGSLSDDPLATTSMQSYVGYRNCGEPTINVYFAKNVYR
ncbi:tryptophan dimethylallyltransferase family protein [Streptomyces chryseus]